MKHSHSKSKFVFAIACALLLLTAACDLSGIRPPQLPRSQPEPEKRQLFPGITYERIVRQEPRPLVIHVVTIDLKASGLKVMVTPGDKGQSEPLAAQTTSEFLQKYNLQLAINGDAFHPWRDLGPLGYFPHDGDRVTPYGFAASKGTIYAQDTDEQPTLYIFQNNKASINAIIGKIYNAVSGFKLLVWNNDAVAGLDNSDKDPRTAIGLNRSGNKMIIIVVDGRQPGYSEGVTYAELAQLLLEQKVYAGMNMDGGGSTTLVIQGADGEPQVLNSPIHNGVVGRERPVGNHLGFGVRGGE
jgi:hypothetical protein